MSLPKSVLLAGSSVPAKGSSVEVLRPYGELDDPLRLLVVLANHVGSLVPDSTERVRVCLDKRAAWRSRIVALRELLVATNKLSEPYAALLDPDALAPAGRTDWEDRTSYRMREDIRKAMFTAIDGGGWIVAQPNPTTTVSNELDQIDIDPQDDPAPVEPEFAVFAPDVRPVARWLVTTGRIPRERLASIVEDTKDAGRYVLRIAYDALPEGARETGRQLHVARTPSECNGHMGRFTWAESPKGLLEVAKSDVGVLERAGMLSADDARYPRRLAMPRRLRGIFNLHASVLDTGDQVRLLHHEFGQDADFDARPPSEKIEVHYHAARAGDLERAKETAAYFGLELRALATQRSRVHHEYKQAALMFQELVDQFDPTDAYAWEYLGYNLALGYKGVGGAPNPRANDILAAYRRAHDLDKKNPLYHGRYLGCRAELGHPVLDEANAALAAYAAQTDAWDFVSWFAKPLLGGLARGGRLAERAKILDSWGLLLGSAAPSVLDKPSIVE